ncbi:MAG TPA: long-chain-fatty-acid--CoA ligase [Alphaproteobacteria bacterium]|nr:long-chain-fatty-acid--CoA ligase [Alphaproteobacteria bacterium]
MLIPEILWHNAACRPHKVAVIAGQRRLTFAATADHASRFANALQGLGIQPGDRIAVLASNTAEHVEIVFGIGAADAVWVPLNFRLTPSELAYIVDDSGAVAVVYTEDQTASIESLRGRVPQVTHWIGVGERDLAGDHVYSHLLAAASATRPNAKVAEDALFAIMYTSGTTGLPKGVMLQHRAFFLGTLFSTIALKASADDIKLQAIPQFHAGGQIYQLAHLAAGATIVVLPRFDPELAFRLIEQEGVSVAGFVPAMLMALVEDARARATNFSRLRRVLYGGSPIPEDRLAQAVDLMKASFLQTYGQTEAGVLATALDEEDHARGLRDDPRLLRSCGREMLGYRVRVADDQGRSVVNGEVGEVLIRAESLMCGYWRRPDATAETLVDGWLKTGDLAWQDDGGRFYIVDRKKDMIVSGGENVYPVEIENVISAHPEVRDVAVIGVPDQRWGEAVKALVILRPGATVRTETIIDACRGKLAGFKIPKSVEFVDSLPRNASGKLLKSQLREKYWREQDRKI